MLNLHKSKLFEDYFLDTENKFIHQYFLAIQKVHCQEKTSQKLTKNKYRYKYTFIAN